MIISPCRATLGAERGLARQPVFNSACVELILVVFEAALTSTSSIDLPAEMLANDRRKLEQAFAGAEPSPNGVALFPVSLPPRSRLLPAALTAAISACWKCTPCRAEPVVAEI